MSVKKKQLFVTIVDSDGEPVDFGTLVQTGMAAHKVQEYVSIVDGTTGEPIDIGSFVTDSLALDDHETWHFFEDFKGQQEIYGFSIPITLTATSVDINQTPSVDTTIAVGYATVPAGGIVSSAHFTAQDTLATSDTNYLTFRIINLNQNGSGTANVIAATDANTTKATGGSAYTAETLRSLGVTATDEDRAVARNDVLKVLITATGVPTALDSPRITFHLTTIRNTFRAMYSKTNSNPIVKPVSATANGEILTQLSAFNEVSSCGADWAGQTTIAPTSKPVFMTKAKFATIGANQRAVIGLASGFNATLDNVALNAWFRLEASMALLMETDDTGTDRDDQSTGVTLTADTYYDFKIDVSSGTSAVFSYRLSANPPTDWIELGTLAMAALPVQVLLFQPVAWIQKASGTGVPSITVDWFDVKGRRT